MAIAPWTHFRERIAVTDRLAALFSTPLEALPDAAARTFERLAEKDAQVRDLLERALEGEARRLLAALPATSSPPVVVATYEGWPPADLRTLAAHLTNLSSCIALLGSRSDKAHLVFAQSEGLGHDLPALLRSALEIVGGRGGGKGNLVQGGGDRPDRLDEALSRAKGSVRAAG